MISWIHFLTAYQVVATYTKGIIAGQKDWKSDIHQNCWAASDTWLFFLLHHSLLVHDHSVHKCRLFCLKIEIRIFHGYFSRQKPEQLSIHYIFSLLCSATLKVHERDWSENLKAVSCLLDWAPLLVHLLSNTRDSRLVLAAWVKPHWSQRREVDWPASLGVSNRPCWTLPDPPALLVASSCCQARQHQAPPQASKVYLN